MSLLPILIVLYLSFYYILPTIPEAERVAFTDPVVQVVIWTVVLFPLLGLSLVLTMAKRLEKLTNTIRLTEEKPQEKRQEKSRGKIESKSLPDAEDEIEVLTKQFFEMHKQLKELSIRDGLTTLFNRRYLDGRLDEEIRRAQRYARPFALEMIDIDHFKQLNDRYGHSCGDEILKQIAWIMKETTRETDIICRYGGEEFCILLIETDGKSAYDHAERLRKTISSTLFRNGEILLNEKIAVSIGVALFPQDASERKMLVESADSALYAAKRGGRNQVKRASELQK